MKSSAETLRRRGLPTTADLAWADTLSPADLLEALRSAPPAACSAAVRRLAESGPPDAALTHALLARLAGEKTLYTRLEICALLETGGEEMAAILCAWVGRIGHNQHRTIPAQVSQKPGYPLARDLAARILANMSPSLLPVLQNVLESGEAEQVREALDALGGMVHRHPGLATEENLHCVLRAMQKHAPDALLCWKGVVCLSAFPLRACVDALEAIGAGEDARLAAEAQRSLTQVRRRMDRQASRSIN